MVDKSAPLTATINVDEERFFHVARAEARRWEKQIPSENIDGSIEDHITNLAIEAAVDECVDLSIERSNRGYEL